MKKKENKNIKVCGICGEEYHKDQMVKEEGNGFYESLKRSLEQAINGERRSEIITAEEET